MKTEQPINKYTIKHDYEKKLFYLWDVKGNCIREDASGRELGRYAWNCNAEAVCYDYDLGLDEPIK